MGHHIGDTSALAAAVNGGKHHFEGQEGARGKKVGEHGGLG